MRRRAVFAPTCAALYPHGPGPWLARGYAFWQAVEMALLQCADSPVRLQLPAGLGLERSVADSTPLPAEVVVQAWEDYITDPATPADAVEQLRPYMATHVVTEIREGGKQ